MARTYKRDARGRFAGGGGGGGGKGGGKGGGGAASARPGQKARAKARAAQVTSRGVAKREKTIRTGVRAAEFLSTPGRKLRSNTVKPAPEPRPGQKARAKARAAQVMDRALAKREKGIKTGVRAGEFLSTPGRKARKSTAPKGKGAPAAKGKPKTAPASKPAAKRGAPAGPRGGKVSTPAQQRKAAREQQQRQKAFASKSTAGRSAKAAYKAAKSTARFERTARAAGGGTLERVKKAKSAVTRMAATRGAGSGKGKGAPASKPATGSKTAPASKPAAKPVAKPAAKRGYTPRPGQKARAKARATQVTIRGIKSKNDKVVTTGSRAEEFLSTPGRKARKSTAPKGKGSSKKR